MARNLVAGTPDWDVVRHACWALRGRNFSCKFSGCGGEPLGDGWLWHMGTCVILLAAVSGHGMTQRVESTYGREIEKNCMKQMAHRSGLPMEDR